MRGKKEKNAFPSWVKELHFWRSFPQLVAFGTHSTQAGRHAVLSICINNWVSKSRPDKNLDRSFKVWRGHGKFKPRKPYLSVALPRGFKLRIRSKSSKDMKRVLGHSSVPTACKKIAHVFFSGLDWPTYSIVRFSLHETFGYRESHSILNIAWFFFSVTVIKGLRHQFKASCNKNNLKKKKKVLLWDKKKTTTAFLKGY